MRMICGLLNLYFLFIFHDSSLLSLSLSFSTVAPVSRQIPTTELSASQMFFIHSNRLSLFILLVRCRVCLCQSARAIFLPVISWQFFSIVSQLLVPLSLFLHILLIFLNNNWWEKKQFSTELWIQCCFLPWLLQMDISCPRCHTTKYRNPKMKLLVSKCGHSL